MRKLFILLCSLVIFAITPFFVSSPIFDPLAINSNIWINVYNQKEIVQSIRLSLLKMSLQEMVQIDVYKPVFKNKKLVVSFCNVGARDVLDNRNHNYWGKSYGFYLDYLSLDISSVFPTSFSILRLSIKEAYNQAMWAAWRGLVKSVTCRQAYELAKQGEVVWIVSAKYNHEAVVYPDERPWLEERGCRIAQCGRYNVITDERHEYCFGKWWKDPEIKYIHFKWRTDD